MMLGGGGRDLLRLKWRSFLFIATLSLLQVLQPLYAKLLEKSLQQAVRMGAGGGAKPKSD